MSLLNKIVSLNIRISYMIDGVLGGCFSKGGDYSGEFLRLIKQHIDKFKFPSVLEVGGIDRPLIGRSLYYKYDGLDIEYKPECEILYDKFYTQSIEEHIKAKYDIIISKTVLEHVKNNRSAIAQIYQALGHNGVTIHYLPSKYHPYSLILRLVGPKWQKRLIRTLTPWAVHDTGYVTFFDSCSPKGMRKLFKDAGFKYVNIIPFYRANDYFRVFFPLYIFVSIWENICNKLKIEDLCSGFIVIAKK